MDNVSDIIWAMNNRIVISFGMDGISNVNKN